MIGAFTVIAVFVVVAADVAIAYWREE